MKNDTRIILRVPSEQRRQIDALIQEGKFKNLSVVVRAALTEFLERMVAGHD